MPASSHTAPFPTALPFVPSPPHYFPTALPSAPSSPLFSSSPPLSPLPSCFPPAPSLLPVSPMPLGPGTTQWLRWPAAHGHWQSPHSMAACVQPAVQERCMRLCSFTGTWERLKKVRVKSHIGFLISLFPLPACTVKASNILHSESF